MVVPFLFTSRLRLETPQSHSVDAKMTLLCEVCQVSIFPKNWCIEKRNVISDHSA